MDPISTATVFKGLVNLLPDFIELGTAALEERLGTEFRELPPRDAPQDDTGLVLRYQAESRIETIRMVLPEPALTEQMAALVRTRRDWLQIPTAPASVHRRCIATLFHLGLKREHLVALAVADIVQLEIEEAQRHAWRFPWEYVLSEATRNFRQGPVGPKSFLILRYLRPAQPPTVVVPTKALFVQSAPGALADTYEFDSEQKVVSSSLDSVNVVPLEDPDLAMLKATVVRVAPDIVHLAGIDKGQGASMLVDANPNLPDGMYFQQAGTPTVVPFPALAAALTNDKKHHPQLVSLNLYNSSEGAAEMVLSGARAAIGFQDEIDDDVAEMFFGALYGSWKRGGFTDLVIAFRAAWESVNSQIAKLRGSGIALWSGVPLLDPTTRRSARSKQTTTEERIVPPDKLEPNDDPQSHFDIKYEAPARLNYSLLHNNSNIVPTFRIKRQKPGVHKSLSVEVQLSAGLERATYRETFNLDDKNHTVTLHDRIRVPLTTELNRQLDESMFSTLYTTVRWGPHVLLEQTDRVEFLPVDEWKYDDLNGRWLPSFVFPRDPWVRRIVDSAQRYLAALRDDSTAGFDGYQSYDPMGASADERCRAIDAQVQAIWWAIVYDHPLGYINPPPSFSVDSQRLRSPSEIVDGRRGTCIDLTLLLAACLEYIEIYPVIFLLNDHAFPGYWRSEQSYEQLAKMALAQPTPQTPPVTPTVPQMTITIDAPWMLVKNRFVDIARFVQDGHIVPIESVLLTSRAGFWPAVEEGLQNLRSHRQFHSMFDMKAARRSVTPLPIWSKRI